MPDMPLYQEDNLVSDTPKICPVMSRNIRTAIDDVDFYSVECTPNCALWIPRVKIADGPAGAIFKPVRCGLKITKGE